MNSLVLPFHVADIQGWTLPNELRFLYDEAVRLGDAHIPGGLLEVGCWLGRSTAVLAQAGPVLVVDTFEGSPGIEEEMAGLPDAQVNIFLQNMEDLGLLSRLEVHQGKSTDILPALHRPLRLIFIDGGHDYETASSDIREAKRLLSPGGTLVVDDVCEQFPGVQRAVRELLDNQVTGVGKMGVWRALQE